MFEVNKEHIDELIYSFLSKEASPEERAFLLKWIEADSSNRMYYAQRYQAWIASGLIRPLKPQSVEQALTKVRKRTQFMPRFGYYGRERREAKKVKLSNVLKYAAAIAVLLVVTTYGLTRHSLNLLATAAVNETIYEAHYGSRAFAGLPDGSKVWLNSGSKLSIQAGYNVNERRVHLIGEAYFEVKTNAEKPFVVQAGNLSIKATGTTFNVKAYPEEDRISATLVEGVIYVEGRDYQEKEFTVKVNPRQTVNYTTRKPVVTEETPNTATAQMEQNLAKQQVAIPDPRPVTIVPAKTEVLTSWMKDRWMIDNEDFGSIARKLERRYNVEIRFASEKLKQYRFTGTIERETVEQMFDVFRYSIPMKYTIEKGVVYLKVDKMLEKQYEGAWRR